MRRGGRKNKDEKGKKKKADKEQNRKKKGKKSSKKKVKEGKDHWSMMVFESNITNMVKVSEF